MLTGHVQIREFLADTRGYDYDNRPGLGGLSGEVLRDFTWFARSDALAMLLGSLSYRGRAWSAKTLGLISPPRRLV
jgi:hypothetical protein